MVVEPTSKGVALTARSATNFPEGRDSPKREFHSSHGRADLLATKDSNAYDASLHQQRLPALN